MGKKKRTASESPRGRGHYMLPGVGDGLVDPDFDNLEGLEQDLIESVGARYDSTEDYD
jgi:hypothetical protein